MFSTATKNVMLDALDPDTVSLHNGDPGAAGANNEITGGGYSRQAATFNAASGGERALATDVDFSGTAAQAVTHYCAWDGATFRFSAPLTGDLAFNASGELTLKAATTKFSVTDPA